MCFARDAGKEYVIGSQLQMPSGCLCAWGWGHEGLFGVL